MPQAALALRAAFSVQKAAIKAVFSVHQSNSKGGISG